MTEAVTRVPRIYLLLQPEQVLTIKHRTGLSRIATAPIDGAMLAGQGDCPVCFKPYTQDQFQLLVLGPATPADRAKMKDGRTYAAVTIAVHTNCLADEPEKEVSDE